MQFWPETAMQFLILARNCNAVSGSIIQFQSAFCSDFGQKLQCSFWFHNSISECFLLRILTTNCSAYHKTEQEMSPQKNEAENQPKRRIKMMAQKSKPKPKPNYDRKAKHPDYVQFRCNAYAFNSIIRDIKDKINERQKKLLKKTPFWNLIELFYRQRIDMNNMNKSDLDLVQLLKTFHPDTKSFKFGTKSFQITGNAVTQILGLPNEGKSVKLVNDRYTATFRTRHFGEKGKPSKNQIESELQKTIALANQPKKENAKTEQKKKMNKGKEKKEAEEEEVDYDKEVVSLILILLCMTFLFANSSSTLHWKLFEHCVNLDTLSSYSWARAVSAYMNESLTAKAKAKAKKGGEASIGAVLGCTILILFLLCERTNIIQPILGKEKETPAILKWSLVELHTRFNQIKDLNDIERKTTREEEDTVEKEKEKEDDEGQQGEAEEAENQGKPDDADQTPELKEAGKKKIFENEAGKEPLAIQDLLVKSMTDQINYRQQQDPSFVCPKRLQLWKDEKNEDSEKKMKELWDIFIQAEKRSKELEVELATYIEKLDNEECVTATMTVESTIQLNEIQNLKRRIAELEGKETRIDMEKIAKKKEIQGKYKAEIQSLLSDPTIFEMEMDCLQNNQHNQLQRKKKKRKKKRSNKKREKKKMREKKKIKNKRSNKKREKKRRSKMLQHLLFLQEYKGGFKHLAMCTKKNKKTKNEAKKDDEELPQFKLISSDELTQEASQPDATNPIPDPPKGTSLHDSIPVGLQQSSDEDEGQKKPTKKKLGWGQRKVWQKIPKADRERIEKHYLSTQPRDIFWAGLNSEKVTNHDLKDIVWDLELSQNVIEAYIQIEEDKIEPMQTESPQYMSTWTWAYMQSFEEPFWHRALYEHLLEKLGKCSVLFFPIISKEEFHFTLLTFHKNERKWRHYNPLRSLGHRKEERCIDIARNFVNIVEGWLEYIRPQARVFIETKKNQHL
ncbi:hypothetical protein Prudu_003613 [Prunus dulcis]|uniref:Aminotransferase-like plant mobile domain-containing protein n=1 Tax=Prunus dulcis TaxID=3755 RepID=A0A4Y1QTE2_PRUDU|nr:hypothetical protein Prudu_003613 [Prunus dulcis]